MPSIVYTSHHMLPLHIQCSNFFSQLPLPRYHFIGSMQIGTHAIRLPNAYTLPRHSVASSRDETLPTAVPRFMNLTLSSWSHNPTNALLSTGRSTAQHPPAPRPQSLDPQTPPRCHFRVPAHIETFSTCPHDDFKCPLTHATYTMGTTAPLLDHHPTIRQCAVQRTTSFAPGSYTYAQPPPALSPIPQPWHLSPVSTHATLHLHAQRTKASETSHSLLQPAVLTSPG